jgi:hypothetical protein
MLYLPRRQTMLDIDRLKMTVDLSLKNEEQMFLEYTLEDSANCKFDAIFSLKHRQKKLKADTKAAQFLDDISHRVMRHMAKKLGARLFLVYHCDNQEPPLDFYEVDLASGVMVLKATISPGPGASGEDHANAWNAAWKELGIIKA